MMTDDTTTTNANVIDERNHELEQHYMHQALKVARSALQVGEVPVGCVIVLRGKDDDDGVVVSHGANQVNATRDATRHAEIVAMDRMLTGGMSCDDLKLPPQVISAKKKAAHQHADDSSLSSCQNYTFHDDDKWINVPEDPNHWKNTYGWGSGRTFPPDVFPKCDLYVTCEPCIQCAAALARVGIGRVFFGCHNDRFGGCGSMLHLHTRKFPIYSGILKDEAIELLRSFYDRENFHAPDEKRRRKDKT